MQKFYSRILIGLVSFYLSTFAAFSQEAGSNFKLSTLFIKDMTWPEIISAIHKGYQSIIIPTGGIEQNGHHMITAKHDYIILFTSHAIASQLGDTLIAPVVSFVPEGSFEPKTGNMQFPGTVGISEHAFFLLLEGITRSLRNTGFKNIYFVGDHGGSISIQDDVALKLTKEWEKENVRVFNIANYYKAGELQINYLLSRGYQLSEIGDHAGMLDTSELMSIRPDGVNLSVLSNNPFPQNLRGDSGSPKLASAELGNILIDIKVQSAVRQIKLFRK